MAVDVPVAPADQVEIRWRPLVRLGAVAAIGVLVMIPFYLARYVLLRRREAALALLALTLGLFSLARVAAVVGLVTGATMLVPPNTGQLGLVIAMLSLIPTAAWLVLLARGLLRSAGGANP